MAQRVYLKKSMVVDKTPSTNGLEFGELAINYASGTGKAFLAHKKYDNTIAKYHEDAYNDAKFATKSEVSGLEAEISNIESNYALSAAVNTLSATVEDDEYVIATAINDLNDRITSVEGNVEGLGEGYLTVDSAATIISNLESQISNAQNTANSAYTYADAISATVKSGYYTKNETLSQIASTSAKTAYSAKTYADNTFLKHATFASYSSTTESNISAAQSKADEAYNNAAAISANVYTKAETLSQIASTSAKTAYSAKTYADNTFLKHATFASYSSTTESNISAAQSKADSAYDYAAAISGTVKNNYYTKGDANTQISNASARTFASAKTYVDNNFVTNNTYTAFTSSTSSELSALHTTDETLSGNIKTLSGNIVTRLSSVYTYKGTKATASQLPTTNNSNGDVWNVEAASGNTPAGTNYAWVVDNASTNAGHWDALGGTVDLSNYATTGELSNLSSQVTGVKNDLSTLSGQVVNNYATKALVASSSAAAVASANSYADSLVEGLTSGLNFLTIESATSVFSNYDSEIANIKATYATSAAVTALADALEEDELVVAAALNNLNERVSAVTNSYGNLSNTYLTVDSAASVFSSHESSISNAQNTANSAYSYTDAVSGTVKNNYYTKNETLGQIASTSAKTAYSAKTYADGTFLTKASAGTMYSGLDSRITTAQNKADSAYNYAAAISGNVYTKAEALTQIASTSAKTAYSAKTYADGTFLTKASAGTMYSGLDSRITTAQNKADSAYNYAAAISGNVYTKSETLGQIASTSAKTAYSAKTYADGTFLTKASGGTMYNALDSRVTTAQNKADSAFNNAAAMSANVYTKTETLGQIASTSAKTAYSAKTYADGTFLTKASGGTMYNNLDSKITNVNNSLTGFSATVMSDYATETEASSYAAAALGNAMAYTDSKISGLSIGDYVTRASAGTMYNALDSKITTAQNKADSAFNNAAAMSANVYTKTETLGQIASTSAKTAYSAKTYADGTFLTKASAGTMYSGIDSRVTTAQNKADSAFNNAAAMSANVYTKTETLAQIASTSAKTAHSAKTYADGTFLTRASAGTMYNALDSRVTTAQNKADSAYNNAAAMSANVYTKTETLGQIASTSAKTAYSAKTYADGTFLTKASAGTMHSGLDSRITGVNDRVTSLSGSVIDKLTNVYRYKGSVTNYSNLPTSNQVAGDVYNVVNANGNTPAGTNYAWNGSAWDALGGTVDLTGYLTKASAGTMYSGLDSRITNLNTSLTGFSATVVNTYATDAKASSYAAAALANSMDYTDSKIGEIGIGDYVTKASAGTMYNALDSRITANTNKITPLITNSGAMQNQITKLNANSGALQNQVTKLNANSGAMNTTLTTHTNQISVLNANSGTMSSTLTAHENKLTRLNTNSGAMQNQITQLITNSGTMQNQITKLNANSGTMNTTLTTHTNQISVLNANSGTMNSTLTDYGNRITKLNANSGAMNTTLTTHTNQITNLTNSSGKVIQENVTGTTYRPLLLASPNNAAQASIPTTTVTATTYMNKDIYAQPSTGEIGAKQFKVNNKVTLQYNATTEALDFIFS